MSTQADAVRSTAKDGEPPHGVLDRVLNLFADVRGGEGVTAVLLMLNIFLLLAEYYLLKTIREPLILTVQGGAEVKSYSAAAIAGLLIILVPLYISLASRVSRVRLINGVTAFFIPYECLLEVSNGMLARLVFAGEVIEDRVGIVRAPTNPRK